MTKIITFIVSVIAVWYLVKWTAHTPPTSTFAGHIDLSLNYSSVKLKPDKNEKFVINIVPIGGYTYLLGGKPPCKDLKVSVKSDKIGFIANNDIMTASCLYDDKLTIMLWNNKYGEFFTGMDEITIQVEAESKVFDKSDVYIMHVPN